MEKYYSLRKIGVIDFDNPKSHITECESLVEVKNFPDTEIIVIKKKLDGRCGIRSNFYYPSVYSYKIVSPNGTPFCLNYRNNRTTDFIIETFKSGYPEDQGWGEISILDSNNVSKVVRINAGFNDSAIFVINILKYLFSFELEFNSNWKYHDLLNEKLEKIKILESEKDELKEKIIELNLKLKACRKKK